MLRPSRFRSFRALWLPLLTLAACHSNSGSTAETTATSPAGTVVFKRILSPTAVVVMVNLRNKAQQLARTEDAATYQPIFPTSATTKTTVTLAPHGYQVWERNGGNNSVPEATIAE